MTEILSAEEVVSERYRYPDSTTEDGANDVIALCESHEALRADRDRLASLVDVTRKHRQWAERSKDAAEARLAEVEQALRTLWVAFVYFDMDRAAAIIYEAGAEHPDCTCDMDDYDCWYHWPPSEQVKSAFRYGIGAVWREMILGSHAMDVARAVLDKGEQA